MGGQGEAEECSWSSLGHHLVRWQEEDVQGTQVGTYAWGEDEEAGDEDLILDDLTESEWRGLVQPSD